MAPPPTAEAIKQPPCPFQLITRPLNFHEICRLSAQPSAVTVKYGQWSPPPAGVTAPPTHISKNQDDPPGSLFHGGANYHCTLCGLLCQGSSRDLPARRLEANGLWEPGNGPCIGEVSIGLSTQERCRENGSPFHRHY